MRNSLSIARGPRLLTNGSTAYVDGCPLASCEHALDIVALLRAAAVSVFDRTTKKVSLTFKIYREFSSTARAIHHAMLEAQQTTGRADFILGLDDGSHVHTWTLAGAGWPSIMPEMCNGVGVRMTYQIVGGLVTYAGPLPLIGPVLFSEGGGEILTEGGAPIEAES